jgi:hypothetical protein
MFTKAPGGRLLANHAAFRQSFHDGRDGRLAAVTVDFPVLVGKSSHDHILAGS